MADDQPNPLEAAAAAGDKNEALAKALLAAEQASRMKRIEGKLGVPHGYYDTLVEMDSDWDFAIKLVVLIEAALGRVIAAHLRNDAVVGHCERLSLDGRAGKLSLAQDLDLLQKDEARAISAMALVRNSFAHRIENIEGDLTSYVKALPKEEMYRLVKHLLIIPKEREQQVDFLWKSEHTAGLFRHIMWTSGSMILDTLARHDMKAEADAERLKRIEQGWLLGHGGLAGLFKDQKGWTKLSDIANLGFGDQAGTPLPMRGLLDVGEAKTQPAKK